MRVSKAKAAQNRERILISAARLFREDGIAATGVDAALGIDISRQPRRVRQAFTEEIKDDLEFLSRLMPDDGKESSYEDAIVTFASMAGALILARAVNDDQLSDLILKSTAKRVIKRAKSRGAVRRS